MKTDKNIALVHDWLTGMRGGEKVLEVLCELFPEATLFTLVHKKGSSSPAIENMKIRTSIIQHLPKSESRYQYYLPLMPFAIERFNLNEFDIVISSSHAVAKGVRVRKDAVHICYCHTPMRYIWDQYENYFGKGKSNFPVRTAMKFFRNYLQRWDVESSSGVNYFIANSKNVQERIKRIYNRDSEVIYPPVEASRFKVSTRDDGYFLIVSALVPYKRIDLAVEAFNEIGERLVIVGVGSELEKLKNSAKPNIEFHGWASDEKLADYYADCKALIFPGEEDFGIVPLEAMASGKPVIAFAKGGALETVVENRTGIFFKEQIKESLIDAVRKFSSEMFNPNEIHRHALGFDRKIFKDKIQTYIEGMLSKQLRSFGTD
jgi:glycosyltransferase involved in cell wall biosynthesis